jgi:hypothetical protein
VQSSHYRYFSGDSGRFIIHAWQHPGLAVFHHVLTQHLYALFQQQLTIDLMGITENALSHFANKMTEDSCFARCRENNEISMCRLICTKKKYLAFFTGDLDTAAKFYDLNQAHFSGGATGESTMN